MLLLFPVFLALGLFLPGFFIAKSFRHATLWAASAFPVSLLVLFHSVFWLGVFRVPVTLWTVTPCLIVVAAGAAWLLRRSPSAGKSPPSPALDKQDRLLVLSSGLVGAMLLARFAVSPLAGFDTRFRWDYLAKKILELHTFGFYPPITAADFRTYFYPDGIPPMVSFTHWWFYASAGRYLPPLTCLFVAAQFACTLVFTYGAAAALFSRRAGIVAAAMLAASPLYFRSVALGQDTGLTALAIAALIYFIVTARQPDDWRAIVSAGLAAALCALSREYGWIALIAGVVALVWRRQPPKRVLLFAAVTVAVAGPWYVRNWVLSGNPFYTLRFAGFAVNPVYDGILQRYQATLGVRQWPGGAWIALAGLLLSTAPFQMVAGIPGAIARFRERGYLAIIALLLTAVWLQSVGSTSGGIEISTRVLSAALVVLSITAAGALDPWLGRVRWRTAVFAAIVLLQAWIAGHAALYPNTPFTLSPADWPQNVFRNVPAQTEFQIRDQLAGAMPAGSRVLSENAYLHAALIDKGIDVVPVWSPEVRFLFSSSPEESDRKLRELHIGTVALYPDGLNMAYLNSASPFYRSLGQRWRVQAMIPQMLYIMVPGQP